MVFMRLSRVGAGGEEREDKRAEQTDKKRKKRNEVEEEDRVDYNMYSILFFSILLYPHLRGETITEKEM